MSKVVRLMSLAGALLAVCALSVFAAEGVVAEKS
jgi:hypothetical protein